MVRRHGQPLDVLQLEDDRPHPIPMASQLVIEVGACALNFADSLLCQGDYQAMPPLPFTPGLEVAGTVAQVGEGVELDIGTRVVTSTLLPSGGFAEQCLADVGDVFPLADSLSDVDAVAMHITYKTAWLALAHRARLQPDEVLLVHAGAGGVGSAAIQVGKALGARVIATAGGSDKVEVCLSLGADLALDYTAKDVRDFVLHHTGGHGADVIFDPVGGDTFTASTRCIAWEGRLVVIGAASGRYADVRSNHLMVKNYSVLGLNWGSYCGKSVRLIDQAHRELMSLHASGVISPLISRLLELDEVPHALDDLSARSTVGKLVVVP